MNKRIRTVTVTHQGKVFLRESTEYFNYSSSPQEAIEREIDEFIETLGQEPEDFRVENVTDNYAKLWEENDLVAEFDVSEEAIVAIGYLGTLDLNDISPSLFIRTAKPI